MSCATVRWKRGRPRLSRSRVGTTDVRPHSQTLGIAGGPALTRRPLGELEAAGHRDAPTLGEVLPARRRLAVGGGDVDVDGVPVLAVARRRGTARGSWATSTPEGVALSSGSRVMRHGELDAVELGLGRTT